MLQTIIRNAKIVNENKIELKDVGINSLGFIEKIENQIYSSARNEIDANGNYLLPGMIDDQVHFREPGLTHKGDIFTESRAAIAGGITSYMEMPNVNPPTLTQELLEEKFSIAAKKSLANFSFYMGVSKDNYDEVMKTNPHSVCGIKIFMGSSTGELLVDDPLVLEKIFANTPILIATHCECDSIIKENLSKLIQELGEQSISARHHPLIRNTDACYASSSYAVNLAKKYGTRLHVLHISTEKELELFSNKIPLHEKKITAEACIHHLWFTELDYDVKGNLIKWNPAIKSVKDREAIWDAVLDGRIDVLATDHAPHTLEEKNLPYLNAPSGGPLVQHVLLALLDFVDSGKISLEKVVEKIAHNVAILYQIDKRGFIKEGYFADLVMIEKKPYTVSKENILYKCKWSPFENHTFTYSIKYTWVNGALVYDNGKVIESHNAQRLVFNR